MSASTVTGVVAVCTRCVVMRPSSPISQLQISGGVGRCRAPDHSAAVQHHHQLPARLSGPMWIREVDFPAQLIDAHRAGELVIFVGAGASRDAPANLPDFRQLTSDIAAEAQAPVTEDDLNQPDVFLGTLHDRQVDVHQRVAAHIGVSTSESNRLHHGLVKLAMAGQPGGSLSLAGLQLVWS
jgi:hypothetical protein